MITLSEIDTNRIEGRLLIAALTILTTTKELSILGQDVEGTKTEPDTMLRFIDEAQHEMYKGVSLPEDATCQPPTFEKELISLLNRFSKENDSNTPDYILADYMLECLKLGNQLIISREIWYNVKNKPGQ